MKKIWLTFIFAADRADQHQFLGAFTSRDKAVKHIQEECGEDIVNKGEGYRLRDYGDTVNLEYFPSSKAFRSARSNGDTGQVVYQAAEVEVNKKPNGFFL